MVALNRGTYTDDCPSKCTCAIPSEQSRSAMICRTLGVSGKRARKFPSDAWRAVYVTVGLASRFSELEGPPFVVLVSPFSPLLGYL